MGSSPNVLRVAVGLRAATLLMLLDRCGTVVAEGKGLVSRVAGWCIS
jgi:hypothetical protein